MASILCENCGNGIHYHSISNGTEYVFIKNDDWHKICSSSFDPQNKSMDTSGHYPKLFRSDTIDDDFPNATQKIWKCPSCGALITFTYSGEKKAIYIKSDKDIPSPFLFDGIAFDDFMWNSLTSLKIPDNKLKDVRPSCSVKVFQDKILTYSDESPMELTIYIRK